MITPPPNYEIVTEGEWVLIFRGGERILSAKRDTLAVFYCWLNAEREALWKQKEARESNAKGA